MQITGIHLYGPKTAFFDKMIQCWGILCSSCSVSPQWDKCCSVCEDSWVGCDRSPDCHSSGNSSRWWHLLITYLVVWSMGSFNTKQRTQHLFAFKRSTQWKEINKVVWSIMTNHWSVSETPPPCWDLLKLGWNGANYRLLLGGLQGVSSLMDLGRSELLLFRF